MPVVRAALIQCTAQGEKESMVRKHERLISKAADRGAQVVCLQELFHSVYFPAEQRSSWFDIAETVPGPMVETMQGIARELQVALVVPMFEVEKPGYYYNTAVVIDADGSILGKYRKNHIPHIEGFWEKYYFRPGNLGYPVFQTRYAKIGVYIDYDRHFPEAARCLALSGAEVLFNPCATVEDLSRYLWFLEQRSDAVANGVFVGTVNRVGTEPVHDGVFYGCSYFCDPYGEILAQGSEDAEQVVVAELDLGKVVEVRKLWQFFRDRRPETYGPLTNPVL